MTTTVSRCAVIILALAAGCASQTTVRLLGDSYTLRDHPRVFLDGSAGALTAAMSDSNSTGRANAANPLFGLLRSSARNWTFTTQTYPFSNALSAALYWKATGDSAALAFAKSQVANPVLFLLGSAACDETVGLCGNNNSIDYPRQHLALAAQTYSIIRSELTEAERRRFAAGVLNDNDTDHNGINPAGQACTPQQVHAGAGTLSSAGTMVTITGGNTSQLGVGAVISDPSSKTVWRATVLNIIDSSHFVTDTSPNWNGFSFMYSPPWTESNCGVIWYGKHHTTAPHLDGSQAAHYAADYPPNGGSGQTPSSNLTNTALFGMIASGYALADDDPRAALLLSQGFDYHYYLAQVVMRQSWTGFTQSGSSYSGFRTHPFAAGVALMTKNSVVSGPDLTGGNYLRRMLPYYLYAQGFPFQDSVFNSMGQPPAANGWQMGLTLYPGDDLAPYSNYFLRNYVWGSGSDFERGIGSGGNQAVAYAYMFMDPALPAIDPNTAAPKQYLFQRTDYELCGQLGINCSDGNAAFSHAISLTGWGDPSATHVTLQSSYNSFDEDHSGQGDWGSVHIAKGTKLLLGGDSSAGNGYQGADNVIDLGGWTNGGRPVGRAKFLRWAGADPTGDSQSRYVYALMDLTGAYPLSGKASRVHRHVIHFKKPGTPDYVIWYDDVATSSGVAIKALLHHSLNGRSVANSIGFSGGNSGGSIVNTQSNSRLLTTVIATGGANTALLARDSANGNAGNGYTHKSHVCAENPANPGTCDPEATAAEWMVVHKPTMDVSGTMPAISQITAPNFRAVQINDPNGPKVAAVSIRGVLQASAAFTTTHNGTAQYVVAGLSAGRYEVFRGSTRVARVTVEASDSSAYFESTGGSIRLTRVVNQPRGLVTPGARVSAGTQKK